MVVREKWAAAAKVACIVIGIIVGSFLAYREALAAAKASLKAELDAEARAEIGRLREQFDGSLASVKKTNDDAFRVVEVEQKRLASRLSTIEDLVAKVGSDQKTAEELAADDAILREFAPLLKKGRGQPVWGKGWPVIPNRTNRPDEPASISLMRACHMLDDYESFVAFMTATPPRFYANDRGVWPSPSTSTDRERMDQIWRVFRKVAPIWADKGLLSP